MSVPTPEELNDAHEYAMSKLCSEIPENYGDAGITDWDDYEKVCKITKKGCQPDVKNPISQPIFSSNGDFMEYDENDEKYGEFWKIYQPGYYVWRTTKNSPRTPVCARGNYLMQRWCEAPKSRYDKRQPGITDVPPFEYVIKNGEERCEITKAYCDAKGVYFDSDSKDCYVPEHQKWAEFFTGSVLIRQNRASDSRLKKNIKLLRKNFPLEGIHLYYYEWNDIAATTYGLVGVDIGFLADEFDPKYIEIDPNGFKTININIKDDNMNKIYAFLSIKNSLKNIF